MTSELATTTWTDPFWEAIAAGELRLPHCDRCDVWV
jgi:hypothetical protein